MPLDLTFASYFMPLFAFLLVFVIMYALLAKTKILGESKFVQVLVSFVIAIIFISFSSVRQYVVATVPWFVVLIVALFFILLIVGLSQKDFSMVKPGFAWVFIILLIIIFLVAAIKVFNKQLGPYLPGDEEPDSSFGLKLKNFFYSQKFLGALLLLIIAAVVAWVITRK